MSCKSLTVGKLCWFDGFYESRQAQPRLNAGEHTGADT